MKLRNRVFQPIVQTAQETGSLCAQRVIAALMLTLGMPLGASAGEMGDSFVSVDSPHFVIADTRLVDGLGTPAREHVTVEVQGGRIVGIHSAVDFAGSEGITVVDGRGATLLPGLVMMHEHMFYPTGQANYTEMLHSFPRLYLAGGVTTARTAGTTSAYADLSLRASIASGEMIGPDMDVTAPYLNGPGLPIHKVHALEGAEDAERFVEYWADEGVTSYKAYMHIHEEELQRVIELAHARGKKVTAHLCSVTYRAAADLGIDNLEHGFFEASDFVTVKQRDACPGSELVLKSLADLDPQGDLAGELIDHLISRKVALTSTLTVYETFTPGRAAAPKQALDLLIPELREQYSRGHARVAGITESHWAKVFSTMMALEKRFVDAGGTLLVGTDPTGYGGVIPGFASKRALELLVEAGFTFEQAVSFASINGARFLGRATEIGSVEVGKRADLVLVSGNPLQRPSDLYQMKTVFKNGVGYDPESILAAMQGVVGLH